MRTSRMPLAILLLISSWLLAACGVGSDDDIRTPTPAATATAEPEPDLERLLPTSATLPLNFLTQPVSRQIAHDVAGAWPDPIAASTLLQRFGFVEALQLIAWLNPAVGSVAPSSPAPTTAAELEAVTVLAMQWQTDAGAADSIQQHADAMLTSDYGDMLSVNPTDLPPGATGVYGLLADAGSPLYATFIWLNMGTMTVLYSGFSGYGDPTAALVDVVVANSDTSASTPTN